MAKQRLEGDFRNQLKNQENLWFMKLQVFPGAHTATPADFMILTPSRRILVECKENRSKIYTFSRSTQTEDLLRFRMKHLSNDAYYLINFWKGTQKKSDYFLIPVCRYITFEKKIPKKSANNNDFLEHLSEFKVDIRNIYI